MTTNTGSHRPRRRLVVRSPLVLVLTLLLASLTGGLVAVWPLFRAAPQPLQAQVRPLGIVVRESSSRLADTIIYELESTQIEASVAVQRVNPPGTQAVPPFAQRKLVSDSPAEGLDAALDPLKELHDAVGLIGYEGRRVGWPFRFAVATSTAFFPTAAQSAGSGPLQQADWNALVRTKVGETNAAVMPIGRRVLGGALNLAFYFVLWAIALQLVVTGWRSLRNGRRRRRGECVHCCYQRAGLTPDMVCPECGCNNW
jgi:hypothetical protein